MLETLVDVEPTLDRHRNAPLLAEREAFLKHRQEQGTSSSALRHLSSALLNITIGLHLKSLREIDMKEIKEAARIWAETQQCNPRVRTYIHCVNYFTFTARRWLLFLGKLKVPIVPRARFADQVDDFATYMTEEQGLTSQSVKMQCFRAATFLAWFAQRHRSLMAMRLDDIDEFLALKATGGWSRRTITSASGGIRAFLKYAECRGWCRTGIAKVYQRGRHASKLRCCSGPPQANLSPPCEPKRSWLSSQSMVYAVERYLVCNWAISIGVMRRSWLTTPKEED